MNVRYFIFNEEVRSLLLRPIVRLFGGLQQQSGRVRDKHTRYQYPRPLSGTRRH